MFTLPRMTARLAAIIPFAALLAAACNTDSNGPSNNPSPSSSALLAQRKGNDDGGGGAAASTFAVLARAAVSCTDGTITGDIGTDQTAPPGAITLVRCPVTGSTDIGGPAAVGAYNAFLTQYAALAPQPGDVCPIITGTLDGQSFAPGVYCVSAEAKTGVVTLNGPSNGTWLFKVAADGSGLTGALTGTNFSVVLAGGAQACNVTWWVAQAATLTDSHFNGSILAGAASTLTRGTFNGNVWAGASGVGDVTVTGTAVVGCPGQSQGHDKDKDKDKDKCNQGVGNGPEGCDPGDSNHHNGSNDEDGGKRGHPGRQGHDRDSHNDHGGH
jgi:ice-binding like protein